MKVKLAGSLAEISGIHLLKSFINVDHVDTAMLRYQIIVHRVF